MMFGDFSDSIKARLYDFKYTPFLASYVTAWIFWNAKVFLIYFNDKLGIDKKIEYLAYGDLEFTYPLVFALFYVFVFPFFQLVFYWVTQWYSFKMNTIKQNRENQKLLSIEDSRNIRNENRKIQEELELERTELAESKLEYDILKKQLEEEYTKKLSELESSYSEKMDAANKHLLEKIEDDNKTIAEQQKELEKYKANGELKSKDDDLALQQQKASDPQNDFLKEVQFQVDTQYNSLLTSLSDEEKILLKIFYENDSKMVKDTYKEIALKTKNLQKATTEKILRSLITKKIVEESSIYVKLNDLGLKVVDAFFKR